MQAEDTTAWVESLTQLVAACEESPDEICVHVEGLHDLVRASPFAIRTKLAPVVDDRFFEELINNGALESAAIFAMGENIGFMLSRSVEGDVIASAWLPELAKPVDFRANDLATALCGAAGTALLKAILTSSVTSSAGKSPTRH